MKAEELERRFRHFVIAAFFTLCAITASRHPAYSSQENLRDRTDRIIQPVMEKYHIPGMAIGIIAEGEAFVFNYGVVSKTTEQPVTDHTLFELGSISKTFTATLASYAQANGYLSLSDTTSKYLHFLLGSAFGDVRLIHLATHTAGGFPLQVPEHIQNANQLMRYFTDWQPAHRAGTFRTYANPSIGALGLIAAKSMDEDFDILMEQRLFPALGMRNSYVNVPPYKMPDYAQGYTKEDNPIRMKTGMLSSEAYGVKSTASDMLRFLQANMGEIALDKQLQHAVMDTHIGYFKAGKLTQSLIWEQYSYPVALATLLEGNSPEMIFNAAPVTEITPPLPPQEDVWINKTGSTNGFGAYIAFIPAKRLGLVLLANKNFPISERIKIAHALLTSIERNMP